MRAIDTNIVVHYLTGDQPKQAIKAKTVIDSGDVFAIATVLLKNEWMQRSVYGFTGPEVAAALRAFPGLPGISVENPRLLVVALHLAEVGMDFADALHLGAAADREALLTFDRRFIEAAGNASVRVAEP